ncbi:hypothetical protein AE457_002136 [Salmonella enterica subsp. enterica serovar Amsterdam]|uniref:hypothetical protein n=1 Tax=Salmonella enterica TaxID=28901 RepID=UPI0009B13F49|nr:hypothetical protein [Salmonella enterica]ECC3632841.1 hypothetical protein [Salmonella enterica subsp. enterica]EAB6424426.1 hypothetical protein [Salmonella enterica subsp. enterica serovar Amsterdam]EAM5212820.1 hypothetical protein [Salmonella enterica]EAN3958346.1 hypothetical protein [Salmonella enterica]EAN6005126.1 hypothetical protein [Salmonella enterica]
MIHKSVILIRKIGHELAYHPYNPQLLKPMKNNILLNNTPLQAYMSRMIGSTTARNTANQT